MAFKEIVSGLMEKLLAPSNKSLAIIVSIILVYIAYMIIAIITKKALIRKSKSEKQMLMFSSTL
jgi:hypothetical protein